MASPPPSLGAGFLRAARAFAERPALELGRSTLTYRELEAWAAAIADVIARDDGDAGPLAAIFAHRSLTAYAGVLGILGAGRGYVPLHPRFPPPRTERMLRASGARTVVVGEEALPHLAALLDAASDERMLVVGPEVADFGVLARRFRRHRFVSSRDMPAGGMRLDPRPPADPDGIAYLLFTSGSTGAPKGVAVRHRNAIAYLDGTLERFPVRPDDRASQAFDLTFDLSVHDFFTTWWSGACLVPLPEEVLFAPARFIRDYRLTLWFSVPSVAIMLARLRLLRPGVFPSLRRSLFCGEALPARSAELWAGAAPNSTVENLYGPTEATIAISSYRWRGPDSLAECRHGLVPIGWIYPGQHGTVVDEDGSPNAGRGELYLSGPQVTDGYWGAQQAEETRTRFVRLPGTGDRLWYRTGDLVETRADGCLFFKGRVDRQIKLRGHRIELAEIDAALREASGSELAVAVPWPVTEEGVRGIIGCVGAEDGTLDEARVLSGCAAKLPPYMVPDRIVRIDRMPLNANGKIDLRQLAEQLACMQQRKGSE